ncbi:FAD/NAD(P)-binding protein [Mesorhizobium liriopis]|uniref:FAD/NAD(P)-binding protein n=1 Tax=Mesorhizobium liriopis TaxID=2953882 RepID=UPI003EB7E5C9
MLTRSILPVLIIGGGFTGAAVAFHLGRSGDGRVLPVTVIEPRPSLGGGVAYSSPDPAHRINVPASRMSLVPDDGEHFSRWLSETDALADDPDAFRPNGDAYPRRLVFGRYVAAHLAPLIERGHVRHVRAEARHIARIPEGWQVTLSNGDVLSAERLVLAASHPIPSLPRELASLKGSERLVADPYAEDALEGIAPDASVLILGTGLTAADMVASLDARGHHGPILMLSRRGLRSRGHAAISTDPFGDFASAPAATVRDLLGAIHRNLDAAQKANLSWHPVFDALREQGTPIWLGLSVAERQKLVRRLRPFWDVHRFRIAPQVEAVLDRRIAEGTLLLHAGRVISAEPSPERGIAVTFRLRGSTEARTELFDAVINTTGPAHREVITGSTAFQDLADHGALGLDPYGLGLNTDSQSRALDKEGNPDPSLLIAGPLARGAYGELMGLPQVSRHAEFIAAEARREAAGI